jgi:hypothetical protein
MTFRHRESLESYSKRPAFAVHQDMKRTIIVAGNSKYEAADEGRKILRKFGIRINDPENGVWLPASKKIPNPDGLAVHRPLHSYGYMDAVTEALKKATTKQEAIDILQSIGRALQSGGYP